MNSLVVAVVIASITACGSVNPATTECGNGTISGAEECDEGAANGTATSCCTATCTFVAAGVGCRASLGPCDQAEACTGASGACPADVTMPDGMPCGGNGVSACSLADTCLAGVCSDNNKAVGASCAIDACHLETCDMTGACPTFVGKTIMITDSHTGVASENMDTQWKTVADGLGHMSSILPVTTLDSLANLSTTDILIVSSGTQHLTQTQRDVVAAFVASGHGVYVQGEFQATFEGNIIFQQIANANGGAFTWGPEITGQFNSVTTGCFATTPFAAMTAFSQNFAVTGTAAGPGVTALQLDQATNQPVTFSYCKAGGGLVVVKTDQDDIRVPAGSVLDVMKNILYRLSHAKTCAQ
jgi:hypothetical protein